MRVRDMKQLVLILVLLMSVSACTPQLTYGGSKTAISTPQGTQSCRSLGNMKILMTSDSKEYLEIEARNSAAKLGANTLVPAGKDENGKHKFTLYKCSAKTL